MSTKNVVVQLPVAVKKHPAKAGAQPMMPLVQPGKLADGVLIRPEDRSVERFFGSITGVSW